MTDVDLSTVWAIDAKGIDSVDFFASLPQQFEEATTLFVEGTAIAPEVTAVLSAYQEPGDFLPGANTIWPQSKKLRCGFSKRLTDRLGELAAHHAEPELFDHLFLFRGEHFLIYWHDAFMAPMWLAPDLPESVVAQFAERFHRPYQRLSEQN